MGLNKRNRDAPSGAFQKQQPPTKRHKQTNKQIDPPDQTAEVEEEPEEVDLEAQEASLKVYLHHAVKLLSKAIKTSKQFETQKLARKVKQAREPKDGTANQAEVAEAEAQLNALKAISPDTFAPSLLSTRIGKIGYLRPHAASLQATLSTPSTSASSAEPSGQSAEGKARNRLLTNKVLKEAWDEVSRALAKRMGKEVEPRAVKEKAAAPSLKAVALSTAAPTTAAGEKKDAPVVEGEIEGEAGPVKRLSKRAERALKAAEKAKLPKPSIKMDPSRIAALALADELRQDDEDEEEEGRGAEDESEDEGPISGSEYGDDDSEIEREMARLGGAGGGEGWSSNEDVDESRQSDADDSEDEATVVKASKLKAEKAPLKPTKPPKAGKALTSSAFLPSLAGGYISYSDSDGEDAKWVKESEKGEKKTERKNRRGQRARQAIWEKKYGSGAKHIAKQNGTPAAPPKGTKSAKTKAGKAALAEVEEKPELDARYQPFDPAKASARPGQAPNPNAVPVAERKVVRPPPAIMSGEKMHPSWEAKKRAAAQAEIVATAPKGKKITFD